MKWKVSMLIFFLLVGLIGANLCTSCGFKEGFEAVAQWKTNGQVPWDGPYSLPNKAPQPDGMFLFANNRSSPECCSVATSPNHATSGGYSTGDGCVCTTPEQLSFLNTRGGNRTVEDGF